jgi:SAM-dependent methyltransferase
MNEYLKGLRLYGDDFSLDQIKLWYDQETEAYANLGSKDRKNYTYCYHALNQIHGFSILKSKSFKNVLGFGSAWGEEFEPIIDKIESLTIIEPSDNLRNDKIGKLVPTYVKPETDGSLKFNNNSFDLITCFGTLHHIPNVSYVLKEIIRTLSPNGYLIVREPIISMGDWNEPRRGLTKNERGIPVTFFEDLFRKEPVEIVSRSFCFAKTIIFHKLFGKMLKRPIFTYKAFIIFDKYLSGLLKTNIHYHAVRRMETLAPSSVFYVIRKNQQN